jgi:hypothetical protein
LVAVVVVVKHLLILVSLVGQVVAQVVVVQVREVLQEVAQLQVKAMLVELELEQATQLPLRLQAVEVQVLMVVETLEMRLETVALEQTHIQLGQQQLQQELVVITLAVVVGELVT